MVYLGVLVSMVQLLCSRTTAFWPYKRATHVMSRVWCGLLPFFSQMQMTNSASSATLSHGLSDVTRVCATGTSELEVQDCQGFEVLRHQAKRPHEQSEA